MYCNVMNLHPSCLYCNGKDLAAVPSHASVVIKPFTLVYVESK